MAGVIDRLVYEIGADVDKSSFKTADASIKGLAKSTAKIAAAAAAAATAIAGLATAFVNEMAGAADQVAKTSDKLGMSVEALQELRYAANLTGVSQEKLDMAMQRMTRRVAEVANGTGAAKDTVEALGLANDAFFKQSPDKQFEMIADALGGVDDQGERLRMTFTLFDSEGVALVNTLNQGAEGIQTMRKEARDLGGIITDDLARASEAYNDQVFRTSQIFKGLKIVVFKELLPVFKDLVDSFKEWFIVNKELITQNIKQFISGMVTVLRTVFNILGGIVKAVNALVQAFGGWERVIKLIMSAGFIVFLLKALTAINGIGLALKAMFAGASIRGVGGLLSKGGQLGILLATLLMIEDLITWMSGGDSVMGDLVGNYSDWKKQFGEGIGALFDPVFWEYVWDSLIDKLTGWKDDLINSLLSWIDTLIAKLSNWWDGFSIFGGGQDITPEQVVYGAAPDIPGTAGIPQPSFADITATSIPTPTYPGSGSPQVTNTYGEVKIDVHGVQDGRQFAQDARVQIEIDRQQAGSGAF